jgi:magnesium chelatase family protein
MATTFQSFINQDHKIHPIQIEVQILQGMPDFQIVGLSSREMREAKERCRAVIKNLGYKFPVHRKIINLSPAHLPKNGTHTDLPIVLGLLQQSKQFSFPYKPHTIFLGELNLNGEIQPIPNITPLLEKAKQDGLKNVYLPKPNFDTDNLPIGLNYFPVQTLKELLHKLNSNQKPQNPPTKIPQFSYPTFEQIIGHQIPKRLLTIAIAGYHHVLFIGSPGHGKTLLAESTQNFTPNNFLRIDSSLTKSKLNQFPEHKYGIVVLNELPECPGPMLQQLKEPLETIPFNFIATMNPCRCGFKNDANKVCYCTDYDLKRYRSKLSGSLLDRFDLSLNIESNNQESKLTTKEAYHLAMSVRLSQINSQIPLKQILFLLNKKSKNLLEVFKAKAKPSTRRILKVLQVAKTIADLERSELITEDHLAESITYQKNLISKLV